MAPRIARPSHCFLPLLACCLFLSAFSSSFAGAEERKMVKTVEVIVTSPFSESDPETAREKAIEKSLAAAVNQVAAEEIPPDIFARRSEAIQAVLSANTQRYIENYRVLEEIKSDEGYQVAVQASVSVNLMVEELRRAGILLVAESLPKVLFLTSQQNLADVIPQYWWSGTAQDSELAAENAMMAALGEQGFDVISRRAPGVGATAAAKRFTPSPDDREAAELGMRLGAEVVVVGQSTAQAAPTVTGEVMRSFKATASIRALDVASGGLLAAATENFATTDSDNRTGGLKALAGAGADAGHRLATLLRSAWLNRGKEASLLRMEVEGTRNLGDFVQFRQALKATEGVRGIRMEILKADQAVIAVDFDGNPQALAAKLVGNTTSFPGLDIYDVSGSGLKVRLVRAAGAADSR